MPTNKYRKPKHLVTQVYRGKELEGLVKKALQNVFSSDGISITPKKVKRVLDSISASSMGGNPVLILEQYPLNSIQVRGKHKDLTYQVVGKTGTQYARNYTQGKNPRTPPQQANRGKMGPANDAWHALTPAQKAVWDMKAKKLPMTGYNLFISNYLLTH